MANSGGDQLLVLSVHTGFFLPKAEMINCIATKGYQKIEVAEVLHNTIYDSHGINNY